MEGFFKKNTHTHKALHKYWHLSLQFPSVGLLDVQSWSYGPQSAFLEGLGTRAASALFALHLLSSQAACNFWKARTLETESSALAVSLLYVKSISLESDSLSLQSHLNVLVKERNYLHILNQMVVSTKKSVAFQWLHLQWRYTESRKEEERSHSVSQTIWDKQWQRRDVIGWLLPQQT